MLAAIKLKAAVLLALAAPIVAVMGDPPATTGIDGIVDIAPAGFHYRVAGDFSSAGKPVDGPLRTELLSGTVRIMKRQVTAAEYARCVDDAACPAAPRPDGSLDVPVVGVSWHDATAYANWMTRKTGVTWRLPTDEEWVFAAAEKVRDETLPIVDPADPASAWIARYNAEASRNRPATVAPQPIGTFGTNSRGLYDLAGNVWEWTSSCFVRATLNGETMRVTNTNCGVRVVEGEHRTYMTDFVRDPRSGGCAAGVPPSNLGFRLVIDGRDRRSIARLRDILALN